MDEEVDFESFLTTSWELLSDAPGLDTYEADAYLHVSGEADEAFFERSLETWNNGPSTRGLSESDDVDPQLLSYDGAGMHIPIPAVRTQDSEPPAHHKLDSIQPAQEHTLMTQGASFSPDVSATQSPGTDGDTSSASHDTGGSAKRKFEELPMPQLGRDEYVVGNVFYCPGSEWYPDDDKGCDNGFPSARDRK
ncbi:hypothetical protein INS49_006965 [Diaporthe citri]|uniref:uncharacterized protein n=1 Tax=Diaporthe citri TaxID=83186 RepID=UPI001C80EE6F|nr:uncharacterized protein INS49_006965 [Diaporthe citri]KAG6365355.1 hypothetical protein INS49_006965 [Diaporthe citri]